MPLTYSQIIGFAFAAAVCLTAVLKGGWPEKVTGVLFMVGTLVSSQSADYRWIEPQYAIMVIDGTMFLYLVGLSLLADRWWPLFAAGFQLLGLVIHLAFAAQERVISLAYMTALIGIGYAVFAALGVGAISHWRRTLAAKQLAARPA